MPSTLRRHSVAEACMGAGGGGFLCSGTDERFIPKRQKYCVILEAYEFGLPLLLSW